MRSFQVTGARCARLATLDPDPRPLAGDEVAGPTVCSLISPGTELAMWARDCEKPWVPGYAAVFRVEQCGSGVSDLRAGDLVFTGGNHASWQRKPRGNVLSLPAGLAPQTAVFARLAGVTWATLVTTTRRPPDGVLVTGLGPVGNLGAQIFQAAGYRVTAVDPNAERRALAAKCGIRDVQASVPAAATFHLALECSGVEQAALDACRAMVKGGEVALVGVPWRARCDLQAFEILKEVFHRYVVLRSGWEWEVPTPATEFRVGSHLANYAAALEWLRDGKLNVGGLAEPASPENPQAIYEALHAGKGAPTRVVDWGTI